MTNFFRLPERVCGWCAQDLAWFQVTYCRIDRQLLTQEAGLYSQNGGPKWPPGSRRGAPRDRFPWPSSKAWFTTLSTTIRGSALKLATSRKNSATQGAKEEPPNGGTSS